MTDIAPYLTPEDEGWSSLSVNEKNQQTELRRQHLFNKKYITRDESDTNVRQARSEGRWEVIHIVLWIVIPLTLIVSGYVLFK